MLRWHSRYRPLQCKPLEQVQSLKHTQVEKKKSNSKKLSSDLHKHAVACTCLYTTSYTYNNDK